MRSLQISVGIAMAVFVLLSCLAERGRSANESGEVEEMDVNAQYMPFQLRPGTDLSQVEIFYGFYSPKAGAGRQELRISGNGSVRLFYSRSSDDPTPQVREGALDPAVVVRLLDFIEGRMFLQLDDHYPPEEGQFARRVIRVDVPGLRKEVAMQRTGIEAFDQIAAGIKLAAALALPEAINGRFFPNL